MSKIAHIRADIFSATANSILIHACNTRGSWGSGIALSFRDKYPSQYQRYRTHCQAFVDKKLIGTCFLVPGDKHDIACLFTSRVYGRRKDPPVQILMATRMAIEDLVRQNTEHKDLHACRFNSGKFAVPWEETQAVLDDLGVSMTVYVP